MRMPAPVLALIALGGLSPVIAHDLDQDEALRLKRSGQILPLEQIVQSVRQRYPGAQLLEVELEEEQHQHRYEVELLTEAGQARELELDARTGQLLKDREDD